MRRTVRIVLAAVIGMFALFAVLFLVAAIASGTATGALRNGAVAAAFAVMTAFWVVVRGEHRANGSLVATRRIVVMGLVGVSAIVGMMVVLALIE